MLLLSQQLDQSLVSGEEGPFEKTEDYLRQR